MRFYHEYKAEIDAARGTEDRNARANPVSELIGWRDRAMRRRGRGDGPPRMGIMVPGGSA